MIREMYHESLTIRSDLTSNNKRCGTLYLNILLQELYPDQV